jgi:hypothetical protein
MRPAPGKTDLKVLDHVGNVRRHGAPDLERIWTLQGVEERKARREGDGTGAKPLRGWTVRDGSLIEVTAQERAEIIRDMPYRQLLDVHWSEPELREIAQVKGYREGWVWYRMRDQNTVTLS